MSNSTSKRKIGVFINNGCGTNIDEQIVSQIADSVYFSGLVEDKKHIIYQKGMGKAGAKFIIDQIKRFGFGQVVIAGYSPEIHRASIESIARKFNVSYKEAADFVEKKDRERTMLIKKFIPCDNLMDAFDVGFNCMTSSQEIMFNSIECILRSRRLV